MKQRKRKEEKNEKHITGNDAAYYKYGRKRRIHPSGILGPQDYAYQWRD